MEDQVNQAEQTKRQEKEFQIFRGIIEDSNSPKKDGKVKVRIMGLHDMDDTKLLTAELPWAEVMQSLSFGYGSGYGITSIPRTGTWVFVILDHGDENLPIVVGAIHGKAGEDNKFDLPTADRLGKYDVNSLALDHYKEKHVIETHSGHTIEIDDFGGEEMIKITHKTGTYIHMLPNGDLKVEVKGKTTINTVGTTDIISGGDMSVKVTGNLTSTVSGNMSAEVSGNLSATAGGTGLIKSSGALNLEGSVVTIKGGSTMVV